MLSELSVSLIERTEYGHKKVLTKTVSGPVIRLERLVSGSADGDKWLRKLRAETDVRDHEGGETITVLGHEMKESVFYGLLPGDGYGVEGVYRPGGVLEEVPDGVRVVDVNPKDINGMTQLRATRRGVSSSISPSFFTSYYLAPASRNTADSKGDLVPDRGFGYIIGDLKQRDFSYLTNPSEKAFPLHSFADVVYPSKDGREFVVRIE